MNGDVQWHEKISCTLAITFLHERHYLTQLFSNEVNQKTLDNIPFAQIINILTVNFISFSIYYILQNDRLNKIIMKFIVRSVLIVFSGVRSAFRMPVQMIETRLTTRRQPLLTENRHPKSFLTSLNQLRDHL